LFLHRVWSQAGRYPSGLAGNHRGDRPPWPPGL